MKVQIESGPHPENIKEGVTMLLGPNQQAFINELRTTTKKQGFGGLHDPKKNCYCALGIACELFNVPKTGVSAGVAMTIYDDEVVAAPKLVVEKLQLHSRRGTPKKFDELQAIVTMNDSLCLSFRKIADILEANADKYFRKPA